MNTCIEHGGFWRLIPIITSQHATPLNSPLLLATRPATHAASIPFSPCSVQHLPAAAFRRATHNTRQSRQRSPATQKAAAKPRHLRSKGHMPSSQQQHRCPQLAARRCRARRLGPAPRLLHPAPSPSKRSRRSLPRRPQKTSSAGRLAESSAAPWTRGSRSSVRRSLRGSWCAAYQQLPPAPCTQRMRV
jgi:hypothetical protein